jgi:N-methylhydantoinase A
VRTPSSSELTDLVRKLKRAEVESVAVGFINSYVQPRNEQLVANYISDHLPTVPVTVSSDLSRQWREYERFTTAAANAYVRPLVAEYLDRLLAGVGARQFTGEFVVLDSAGGALDHATARSYPIRLVESGPVAGVIGARDLGRSLGMDQLVSFDMGGTTAKCCLIEGGSYAFTELYWVGGYSVGFPVAVPTVEVTEVGAGGGSISWKDEDGRLHVGPRSAGAYPGPACYGLGGSEATVTDANLVAGRLPAYHFATTISLDPEAGRLSIAHLAASLQLPPMRVALGIIRLANLSMAAAVRRQTLERGRDPREFTMVAFGGAGPMHACEVAREVGIRRVVIPQHPGHFSAIGMLKTNVRLEHREAFPAHLADLEPGRLQDAISRAGDLVRRRVESESKDQVELTYSLAIRYHGQEHSLLVPHQGAGLSVTSTALRDFRRAFEEEYVRRYGHLDELSELEVVFFQVLAERHLADVSTAGFSVTAERTDEETVACFERYPDGIRTKIISRGALAVGASMIGPCILYEDGCTSVIPPGARAEVASDGSLIVELSQLDD